MFKESYHIRYVEVEGSKIWNDGPAFPHSKRGVWVVLKFQGEIVLVRRLVISVGLGIEVPSYSVVHG